MLLLKIRVYCATLFATKHQSAHILILDTKSSWISNKGRNFIAKEKKQLSVNSVASKNGRAATDCGCATKKETFQRKGKAGTFCSKKTKYDDSYS
jgi:hypothetical protein